MQDQQQQQVVQLDQSPGQTIQYHIQGDLQQQQQTATTTQMYKCPMCEHMEFLESSILTHIRQVHVLQEQVR